MMDSETLCVLIGVPVMLCAFAYVIYKTGGSL